MPVLFQLGSPELSRARGAAAAAVTCFACVWRWVRLWVLSHADTQQTHTLEKIHVPLVGPAFINPPPVAAEDFGERFLSKEIFLAAAVDVTW